jgi:hypothetical protein
MRHAVAAMSEGRAGNSRLQRTREETMAKPRVTATDRLANVIEVVELGQRTGLLSVERGSGSVLEEGELYFVGGRVIYASLAGLRGREALNALGRWGPCRFAFDRDAPPPAPNIAGSVPSAMPQRSSPSGWLEQNSVRGYSPHSVPGESSGFWPSQPVGPASGPLDGGGHDGYGSWPGGAAAYTPPQPSYAPVNNGAGAAPHQSGGLLMRRPRRAPDVRDLMSVVTSYNLSRSHRTILLLADGEHTMLDLARLSSKSVDEVSLLLSELEARGLVYYYD